MASGRGHLTNVTVRWDPGVEAYFTACFGAPRLAAMSAALARPSLTPTLRTNTLKARQEDVLLQLQEKLPHSWPPPSGALRAHPSVPATVVIRGRGPCEVPYDESLPEVVINRLAAEAVLKGAHVYAPGLLAASPGIAAGDLVAVSAALERPAGQRLETGEEGTLESTRVPAAGGNSEHDYEAAGAISHQNLGCTNDVSLNIRRPRSARRLATGINRGTHVAADGSVRLAWASKPSQPQGPKRRTDHSECHAPSGVRQLSQTPLQTLPKSLAHETTHPPSPCEVYGGTMGADSLCENPWGNLSHPNIGNGSDDHFGTSYSSVGSPDLGCSSTVSPGVDCDGGEDNRGEGAHGCNCGAAVHGSYPRSAIGSSSAVGRSGVSRRSDRLFLGLARAEMGRRAMFRAQQGCVLSMEQRLYDIPSWNGILPGQLMLQALPSILAAQVLNPAPGSRVLDMCAAPGGKTTALAALMGGRGRVVALDRTTAKVDEILSLAADMGASCVEAYKADATSVVRTDVEAGAASGSPTGQSTAAAAAGVSVRRGNPASDGMGPTDAVPHASLPCGGGDATSAAVGPPPYPPGYFDYVLLDPPCSALGLRPRLLHAWSLTQLRAMAAYQRSLLYSAVQLLAPGGEMVYCTCTINPDENEANVAWALKKFDGQLELLPAEPLLGLPGLTGSDPQTATPWLHEAAAKWVQRFDPGELLPGRRMRGPQGTSSSPAAAAAGPDCATPVADAAWEDGWDELADDVMGFFIARFRKSV